MDGSEEVRMLAALRRGDADAFKRLTLTMGPRVHSLARRYARNEADAEDLTQDIFVALSSAIGSFRGESSLNTFVYRIAMNHCIKHFQRRKPPSEPLDDCFLAAGSESDPECAAEKVLLREQLERALATLSDDHRAVVILHELHELTYAECSAALGVPVGTVKSRLFHALRKLRGPLAIFVEEPS